MDDDVKNLYQKFGKSGDDYQEINRVADGEQARQRWPLLRDVNVHAVQQPPKRNRPIAPRIHAELVQVARSREAAEMELQKKIVAVETLDRIREISATVNQSPSREVLTNEEVLPLQNPALTDSLSSAQHPGDIAVSGDSLLNKIFHKDSAVHRADSSASHISELRKQEATGDTSIDSLFNRLAGKSSQEPAAQVSGSFFSKIFKS